MGRLFSFQGRTNRLGYWRVQLLCIGTVAIVWAIGNFAIIKISPIGAVVFAALAPIVLVGLATYLRRLHDRGKNLWWLLLYLGGPWACYGLAEQIIAAGSPAAAVESLPFSLAGLGLTLWALVEVGFLRGKAGVNRFGEEAAGSWS